MRELIEPISTIRPPWPAAIIARPAARAHQNVPVRLTSSDPPPRVVGEVLGRAPDLDPGTRHEDVDATVALDDARRSGVADAARIGDVDRDRASPRRRRPRWSRAADASSRSAHTTVSPRSPRARATARPMPEPAPVTTATLTGSSARSPVSDACVSHVPRCWRWGRSRTPRRRCGRACRCSCSTAATG